MTWHSVLVQGTFNFRYLEVTVWHNCWTATFHFWISVKRACITSIVGYSDHKTVIRLSVARLWKHVCAIDMLSSPTAFCFNTIRYALYYIALMTDSWCKYVSTSQSLLAYCFDWQYRGGSIIKSVFSYDNWRVYQWGRCDLWKKWTHILFLPQNPHFCPDTNKASLLKVTLLFKWMADPLLHFQKDVDLLSRLYAIHHSD